MQKYWPRTFQAAQTSRARRRRRHPHRHRQREQLQRKRWSKRKKKVSPKATGLFPTIHTPSYAPAYHAHTPTQTSKHPSPHYLPRPRPPRERRRRVRTSFFSRKCQKHGCCCCCCAACEAPWNNTPTTLMMGDEWQLNGCHLGSSLLFSVLSDDAIRLHVFAWTVHSFFPFNLVLQGWQVCSRTCGSQRHRQHRLRPWVRRSWGRQAMLLSGSKRCSNCFCKSDGMPPTYFFFLYLFFEPMQNRALRSQREALQKDLFLMQHFKYGFRSLEKEN